MVGWRAHARSAVRRQRETAGYGSWWVVGVYVVNQPVGRGRHRAVRGQVDALWPEPAEVDPH